MVLSKPYLISGLFLRTRSLRFDNFAGAKVERPKVGPKGEVQDVPSNPFRRAYMAYDSNNTLNYGDCSSVGRAPDCDSGRRGFESHQSPHLMSASPGR